jgi:hypothetical protein
MGMDRCAIRVTWLSLGRALLASGLTLCLAACKGTGWAAETDVYLLDMPDYGWEYGCMGTACGNLFGFWDRNGLPNFYTGPTAGGLAPLDSRGTNAGIRSMWASQAGFDGRPAHQPGHVDDYWQFYECTDSDNYVRLGRPEHAPDCIGDFIGLNQKKWTNMNDECDGNIDAYVFVYWDKTGQRRLNFQPTNAAGQPVPDLQSGLRAWTRYRGYEADVFTQLTAFNPTVPPGRGFTFSDLRREIDAGYPVLLFLQEFSRYYRSLSNPVPMAKANPEIHSMLAYGYQIDEEGTAYVRYRESWASGDGFSRWTNEIFQAGLPCRGVIGYHPKPKIVAVTRPSDNMLTLRWEGPRARLYNAIQRTTNWVHRYVIERATTLTPPNFVQVAGPTTDQQITLFLDCGCVTMSFFRVRLLEP